MDNVEFVCVKVENTDEERLIDSEEESSSKVEI